MQNSVEFDELIPGRFNPYDYEKIIVGGGYLLRPSPDFFYDKFRIPGNHILNACGLAGAPDDLQYLDDYAYVSVRSIADRKKLDYLEKEVKVVPCTSMLLKDLEGFKLGVESPSVGVHLTSGILDYAGENDFIEFISHLGLNVYFMPITTYQQDSVYLNRLRLRIQNSQLFPILRADELFTLIGKFDYFISASLHGGIFAYAHKIPFILIDREKTRNFMQDRGLTQYLFTDSSSARQAFETLVNDPPDYSRGVTNDYRTLDLHVRAILRILPTSANYIGEAERETNQHRNLNELDAQIQQMQLQTLGLAKQIRSLERELAVKSRLLSQFIKPMETLADLYSRRPDLQAAFPEVGQGNYSRVVRWARDVVEGKFSQDVDRKALMEYAKWYVDNAWLGERTSTLSSVRSKLGHLLLQAKKKLCDVRHSFGSKFTRLYGARKGELTRATLSRRSTQRDWKSRKPSPGED
jgi:hypothetical protein